MQKKVLNQYTRRWRRNSCTEGSEGGEEVPAPEGGEGEEPEGDEEVPAPEGGEEEPEGSEG